MQETWKSYIQVVLMACLFVVASQMDVAIFTRRAKTAPHWTRQRQLKRDSVFHFLRRDESKYRETRIGCLSFVGPVGCVVRRVVLKTLALLPLFSASDNSTTTAFPFFLFLLQHIISALLAFFLILHIFLDSLPCSFTTAGRFLHSYLDTQFLQSKVQSRCQSQVTVLFPSARPSSV
jgi:hypothetical protein